MLVRDDMSAEEEIDFLGPPKRKRRANPERAIQVAIRHRLSLHGVIAMHIPNEGKRSVIAGRRLRGEGMMPGAPDLICICPGGKLAWLEVKAPGGRLSPAQVRFHETLRAMGQHVAVVTDQDQAVAFLQRVGCIA